MGAQSVKLKVQSCLYRTSSGFVASRGCFREVSLATPTTSRKLWAGQRQNLSWFSIKSGDCQWERGDNATGRSIRSLGFKPTMSRSARSRYCRRHIVEGSFFCDLGGQWERGDNATGKSIRSPFPTGDQTPKLQKKTKKKVSNTSHRSTSLPLLRFRPGGVRRELVVCAHRAQR